MWEQSCSLIYSASWTEIEALNVEVSSQESVSHFLKTRNRWTLERRTSELFRSQLLKLVFCSCAWPLSSTLPSSAYLSLLLLPLICPPHYFLFLLVNHFSVRLLDWTQEIFFVSSYLSHADFFLLLISLFMLHTLFRFSPTILPAPPLGSDGHYTTGFERVGLWFILRALTLQ